MGKLMQFPAERSRVRVVLNGIDNVPDVEWARIVAMKNKEEQAQALKNLFKKVDPEGLMIKEKIEKDRRQLELKKTEQKEDPIYDPENMDIAQATYDRMMSEKTPVEREQALNNLIKKLKPEGLKNSSKFK